MKTADEALISIRKCKGGGSGEADNTDEIRHIDQSVGNGFGSKSSLEMRF